MESIFTFVANGFLTFSNAIIIAPLLIVGFATRGSFFIIPPSRKGTQVWGYAILLVLFTMIFNAFLKSLFQVPLNPALGVSGFAFPSGHMQVSVVLYGWLALVYRNQRLRGILLFLLLGMGIGLIQVGYHDHIDVMGSFIFGATTVYAFAQCTMFPSVQTYPPRLGLKLIPLAGLMVFGIYMRIGMPSHIPKVFAGLIAFALFWYGLGQIHRLKDKL
jgi:undecaprenyl-diphosphatase